MGIFIKLKFYQISHPKLYKIFLCYNIAIMKNLIFTFLLIKTYKNG
ncbi:hypothetical protein SULYE_1040 [Sulfurihydrogenibium yellowstonense SS-5]|uniref:Uncharacterized protein n=1 Tax=Sulfurihydrogenibium yellowstonense SS-5 TaxID=432331 RepID=C4FKE0_9AQUI|nr:hypothetical protein SULYE_1040 [Sulfurihydrogenibium yellowstonense SS-5]